MFPPLLFLWFNANDQTGSVKGTKWKDQYCYGYTGNLDLHNWLTDSSGGHGFIRRGMTYANLATIKGLPLSQKLGIKYLTEGGSLQKALYGLIFLTPGWYREHTANAMLFLEEICEYIFYGKINVSSCSWLKEPEQFDAVCKSLYGKLTWLNGSGIFNSTETPPTLGAVYNYSPNYTNNMYHSKLKPENFKLYISWLTDNLQHIINALKEMENSARSWTPNGLESAQNTGPFPYGFLFRDTNWESNKYTFCTEINDIIEGPSGLRALAALCYRSQCSNNFLCSVESSSVIGTSVLGGAIGCTLAYVHFYVPGGIVGLF
ncbi:secreted antigen 1 [Babesia caballi]|uniref:Secreted antigen 1 n=1 Tax=Babesia caballi TaxID=5871 RepID=A0AAV4LM54_BABCB|nr:secreted antigen 1 [Babesia caballi]